jgi:hypothetical protein
MAQGIGCKKCNTEGFDAYTIHGELWLECVSCESRIEGKFVIGESGWIEEVKASK